MRRRLSGSRSLVILMVKMASEDIIMYFVLTTPTPCILVYVLSYRSVRTPFLFSVTGL